MRSTILQNISFAIGCTLVASWPIGALAADISCPLDALQTLHLALHPEISLKAAAADDDLIVGTEVRATWISAPTAGSSLATVVPTPPYLGTLVDQFGLIKPGQDQQWNAVEPEQGVHVWCAVDLALRFAVANNVTVKGGALVWHEQVPMWAQSVTTVDAGKALLKKHIQETIEHFESVAPGTTVQWDVVNEPFDYECTSPCPLNSFWITRAGSDYIANSFRWAREKTNAKLFLNEGLIEQYGVSATAKRAALLTLLQQLIAQGVPIDGVGLQFHVSAPGTWSGGLAPDLAAMNALMTSIQNLGLEISVTEIDVGAVGPNGQQNQLDLAGQAAVYDQSLQLCLSHPNCKSFIVWGYSDPQNWRVPDRAAIHDGVTWKDAWVALFNRLSASHRSGPAPADGRRVHQFKQYAYRTFGPLDKSSFSVYSVESPAARFGVTFRCGLRPSSDSFSFANGATIIGTAAADCLKAPQVATRLASVALGPLSTSGFNVLGPASPSGIIESLAVSDDLTVPYTSTFSSATYYFFLRNYVASALTRGDNRPVETDTPAIGSISEPMMVIVHGHENSTTASAGADYKATIDGVDAILQRKTGAYSGFETSFYVSPLSEDVHELTVSTTNPAGIQIDRIELVPGGSTITSAP